MSIKTYRMFFAAAGFLFSSLSVNAQTTVALSQEWLSLQSQGKFREALQVYLKLEDSLTAIKGKNKGERENREFVISEGAIYENIGDFSKAEQIYKAALNKTGHGSENTALYRKIKNRLSLLYEKMGDEDNAEAILEELVASEYSNQYRNTLNDSLNRMKSKLAGGYGKAVEAAMAQMYSSPYYQQMLKMGAAGSVSLHAPTQDDVQALKTGKFDLVGDFSGEVPSARWDVVQRLFAIYAYEKKYRAAESLIRQAIAYDDLHPETKNRYQEMFPKYFLQGFEKMPQYKGLVSLMKSGISLMNTHSGKDIYYIKNKVLLAQLYQETGNQKAFNLLSDTICRLCDEFEVEINPYILYTIAEAYKQGGRYQNAISSFRKLLNQPADQVGMFRFIDGNYADPLQELADLYIRENDLSDAEAAMKKSLGYDDAARRGGYPDHLKRMVHMAQFYEQVGRYPLAEDYCNLIMGPEMNSLRDNFNFLSEEGKLSWLNTQISAFDFAASLLITDRKAPAAFVRQVYNQQLQLKSLVLNDQERVLDNIRGSTNAQLKLLLADWQSTRAALAWQYSQPPGARTARLLDSMKQVANDLEKRMTALSEPFRKSQQNKKTGFRDLQAALADQEAGIEFVRFNYFHQKWTDSIKYGAFIFRKGMETPRFVPLCDERRLVSLMRNKAYFAPSGFYGGGADSADARKKDTLYDLIWKPLQPFLGGIRKIALSPAGLLNRVAFNALRANDDAYLVDNYSLRQYISLAEIVIAPAGGAAKQDRTAVLYGGIDFDAQAFRYPAAKGNANASAFPPGLKRGFSGQSWGPLPGTLTEVNEVGAILSKDNVLSRIITGAEASEGSLKQLSGHSPWILHLATHGFSLPAADSKTNYGLNTTAFSFADDPMFRSGIIMAGGNFVWGGGHARPGQEDGILTAFEISGLDLSHTDLVVLSACETALGDIRGSEGVFGLQRAFKYAGVKNTLVALWNIPDKQTAEMMKLFYSNKLKGMSNDQALHAAQIVMRKKYPPYYWAAFELIE